MTNIPFIERRFTGIDVSTPAELLPEGRLTIADNVVWQNGHLTTRPGLRAQLAEGLTEDLGASFGFETTVDGETAFHILFVAGTSLRVWNEGDATTAVVSGEAAFDLLRTQFTRLGDYVFIAGATDGDLYRYGVIDGVFERAMGLAKPTGDLTAVLSNEARPFVETTGYDTVGGERRYHYGADFVGETMPMPIPDPLFTSTGLGNWTIAGIVETHTSVAPDPATVFVRMDDQASSITLTTALDVPDKYNETLGVWTSGVPVAASWTRKATLFNLHLKLKRDYARESIVITLIAIDGDDNEVGRSLPVEFKTVRFGVGAELDSTSLVEDLSTLISFAGIATDEQVCKLKILIEPGPDNVAGDFGPYFTDLQLTAYGNDLAVGNISGTGDSFRINVVRGGNALLRRPDDPHIIYSGNSIVSAKLFQETDMDTVSRLTLPFTIVQNVRGYSIRLGLRKSRTERPTLTDLCETVTEAGQTYLSVDISGIDAAERQNINYIDLVFVSDMVLDAAFNNANYASIFTFGHLLEAGNLSVGLSYDWGYREVQQAGTVSELSSPLSVPAGTFFPTEVKAIGRLSAASVPLNVLDPAIQIEWFRRGGTFEDGYWRLVGRGDVSGDTVGTGWQTSVVGGVMTFIDNVPDSALYLAPTLTDHDPVPTGVLAVGVHASRLALMTEDRLYLSRISFGRATGLYFNYADSPTDPDIRVRGFSTRVSGVDGFSGGRIQRMTPLLTRLALFFEGSIYQFAGTDPLNFSLARFSGEAGIGAASPNAIGIFDNVAFLLTNVGLRLFTGTALIADVGNEIEDALIPDEKTIIFSHENCLFISSGDQRSLFVFDRMGKCWTRWNVDAASGLAHGNRLYILSSGQILTVGTEFGDTTVLAGAVEPVAVTVQSRSYTRDDTELNALRLSLTTKCADIAPVLDLQVTADEDLTARTWQQNFTSAAGEQNITDLPVDPRVRGRGLTWRLGAVTLAPLTLKRLELVTAPGRRL